MNILLIDDDVDGVRRKAFKKFFGDKANFVWRENPIHVSDDDLKNANLILLDNDMCLRRDSEICPTSKSEKCTCVDGVLFAKSLAERFHLEGNDLLSKKTIIIHSMNSVAADRIKSWIFDLDCIILKISVNCFFSADHLDNLREMLGRIKMT